MWDKLLSNLYTSLIRQQANDYFKTPTDPKAVAYPKGGLFVAHLQGWAHARLILG
jgi:hypothetical protein